MNFGLLYPIFKETCFIIFLPEKHHLPHTRVGRFEHLQGVAQLILGLKVRVSAVTFTNNSIKQSIEPHF
jgi:hypothetical protein